MKRTLVVLALCLAVVSFTLWLVRQRHPAGPRNLTIAFTCDVHGRLVPCGCFGGQMGGLTRIATLLGDLSQENSLKVDVGNALDGTADYQRIQYRYILQAFHEMGFEAANLGHAEARLTAAQLREIKAQSSTPLLSANLLDRKTGAPIFEGYRIVERGGARIALVGVMDEHLPVESLGEGVAIEPMAAALARLLPTVRKESDYIILLAFADEAALHRLARDFYEVQVILGGNVSQPAQNLERENRSLILYTTNQSRALGTLDFTLGKPGKLTAKSGEVMLVTDKIPERPEIRGLAGQYRDEVRRTKLLIDDPVRLRGDLVPGVRSAAGYAGSASCIACHAGAGKSWQGTAHAHAFQALIRSGADADPNCIGCHTVGFGTASGYHRADGASRMTDVGCEECHGPGSAHVAQRQAGAPVTMHFRPLGAGDCQKCHQGEFSRPFDWKEFWPVIAHGRENTAGSQPVSQ